MLLTKKVFAQASTAMLLGATLCLPGALALADQAFIPKLVNTSTIPANGDLNPYGVAFVPKGFPGGGAISTGDVLVSNFNNSGNVQGTGTTIIQFTPGGLLAPPPSTPGGPGNAQVFFTSPLAGLSTALGVLRGGLVIVGNVPTTTNGTTTTIGTGSLQVIDKTGKALPTITDTTFLDSPWDLALDDDGAFAHIFVSNVLSGTVSRLDVKVAPTGLTVMNKVMLAKGYKHEPNGPALVVGPTGLAFDESTGALYVASTDDNAIYVIWNAATATQTVNKGMVVFDDANHLRGPLALRFAPNGHLLTANGDALSNADPEHPSEIVEFTKFGQFIREYNVDAGLGGAFGLDTVSDPDAPFNYAAIDDVTNNLSVYRLEDIL